MCSSLPSLCKRPPINTPSPAHPLSGAREDASPPPLCILVLSDSHTYPSCLNLRWLHLNRRLPSSQRHRHRNKHLLPRRRAGRLPRSHPTGDEAQVIATPAAAQKSDTYPLINPLTQSSEKTPSFNPIRYWGNLFHGSPSARLSACPTHRPSSLTGASSPKCTCSTAMVPDTRPPILPKPVCRLTPLQGEHNRLLRYWPTGVLEHLDLQARCRDSDALWTRTSV
ncbi:hypothetical protein A0H81_00867 [Grifola frondosa]|uniref:Uncharacterized protein n=1 Tax=Grifola frondosa TaxID=5627 RepID=A0A1C7MRU5_GRIFR|nr:hypothetical protein A0H81_00867 [Grifola frondosa]